jgi:hypothetical protein
MSEMGGRLPGDPQEIAKRSRLDVRKVRHDVLWFPRFFVKDIFDGSWRSERLEKQAAKYSRKIDTARQNGKLSNPEMGELPPLDLTPEMGGIIPPELGDGGNPHIGDYTRGSQTQTQTQEKSTSPTPPQAEGGQRGKGKKPRTSRKSKAENADPFVAYSLEVSRATIEVVNACPLEDYADGRKITVDPGKVADRIDGILKAHPKLDGAILVEAWKSYLLRKPKQIKAPQYYFGALEHQSNGEGANWLPDVRLLWHLRQTHPPPQEPESNSDPKAS